MNLIRIAAVIEELKSAPEVTKNEAMKCFMEMGDRIDAHDSEAVAGLVQIVGCAATCDSPEMTRRFIKYISINGPL